MLAISEKDQRVVAWIALILGALASAAGVFGIWMQGIGMYAGIPLHLVYDNLCFSEVYLSMFLAPLVTCTGAMLISWVILASKLTANLSAAKRNMWFALFAVMLLAGILWSSRIAAVQDWSRSEKAARAYFERAKTNSIAPSHVRPGNP
jgi:hypothetical protein